MKISRKPRLCSGDSCLVNFKNAEMLFFFKYLSKIEKCKENKTFQNIYIYIYKHSILLFSGKFFLSFNFFIWLYDLRKKDITI